MYGRAYRPIESPVEQSRRHQELLYAFMAAHRERFMGKLLGLRRRHFRSLLTPQHFVAVSSRGRICGKGRSRFPEVVKADQVARRILEYHEGLRNGFFSTSLADKDMDAFDAREFEAVTEFLLAGDCSQTPLEIAHRVIDDLDREAAAPAQGQREATGEDLDESEQEQAPKAYRCRGCDSGKLRVTHGPYGYYFKCTACDANTPIVELCEACSGKMKVRKSGDSFTLHCEACRTSRPFWQNPPADAEGDRAADRPAPEPPAKAKAEEEQQRQPGAGSPPACPRCGTEMVLRKARKGANAGKPFWGCPNFPKCRAIVAAGE